MKELISFPKPSLNHFCYGTKLIRLSLLSDPYHFRLPYPLACSTEAQATDWPGSPPSFSGFYLRNSTNCLWSAASFNSLIYLSSNPTLSPPGRDLASNSTAWITQCSNSRCHKTPIFWPWLISPGRPYQWPGSDKTYSHFKNYDKGGADVCFILNVFLHRNNVISDQVLWYCCC